MHSWYDIRAPKQLHTNVSPECRYLRCLCCVISLRNQHIFIMCTNVSILHYILFFSSFDSVFHCTDSTFQIRISFPILANAREIVFVYMFCCCMIMNICPLHFLIFHFSLFWYDIFGYMLTWEWNRISFRMGSDIRRRWVRGGGGGGSVRMD